MAYDFFLSYRRADQALAGRLVEALERRGVSIWWDQKIDAGVDWRDAIVENLIDAHVLVILFSEECNDSKQLKKELALADDMDKDVVPVLIEDTKPKGHFLYELASRNWVQIHPHPERKIEELADRLLGMTGKAPARAATPSAPVKSVEKTVSKSVSKPKKSQSQSQSPSKRAKAYRNFLPFRWIDIPIVLVILSVMLFVASGGRIEMVVDNIKREPLPVLFFLTCAFAIYGAFAFPIRYFLRNLKLSRAAMFYVASAVGLYAIGFGAILLIVLEEGRWHNDIWEVLILCAIASVVLGVIAFAIYGVMHFSRSMRLFKRHVEEI